MAKRFTDTAKWDKAWFRKLSPKMKCAWIFLCDKCDHAGIGDFDIDAFEYFIGEPITVSELLKEFDGKIIITDNEKVLVQDFIDFQYGKLNPQNRVHQSVIQRIEKFRENKPLISPLQRAKDKDKDKDKEKEKEKEKEKAVIVEGFFEKEKTDLEEQSASHEAITVLTALNSICFMNHRPNKVNIGHINARLEEGYKLQDFIDVINFKAKEWLNDPKMGQYLRPKTLFCTNFDGYLQAARINLSSVKFGGNFQTPITPDNPTGNPYLEELKQMRKVVNHD